MIADITVAGEIPSPSSSPALSKQQKGIWTCMMSVMAPTSAGCTLGMEIDLALDLSLIDVEGRQFCWNTRLSESSVSCTPDEGRPGWGWWREPPCLWDPQWQRHYGSQICKEIELRAIRSRTQLLPDYGRRRSKCDTIMFRIWQPFLCCSTLSTALELRLWALAQKIRQYTYLDPVCSLCFGQVSHPSDILVVVVLKHLEEPHDQSRCNGQQHLKVHICRCLCPHPRRHVRWMRRPRECALCAVFIPPHSLLAFLLAAL